MNAEAKIKSMIAAEVAAGTPQAKAHDRVLKANPELREQWVAEENAARRAG